MKTTLGVASMLAAGIFSLNSAEPSVSNWVSVLKTFESFTQFDVETGPSGQDLTLTSPLINLGFPWSEAILSWNTSAPDSAQFEFEAAPQFEGVAPRFYPMGSWGLAKEPYRRKSLKQEFDPQVSIDTDTLVLKQPVTSLRVRIKILGAQTPTPNWIKFLAVSCSGPKTQASIPSPNPATPPPKTLESHPREPLGTSPAREPIQLLVPALSQLDYPDGKAWCSPTSLTMTLNYWGKKLHREDLLVNVPRTAAAVFDPDWGGTGNWSFNAAFAGTFPGMRAYVTRFEMLAQIETCVRLGVPVIASVSYNRLKGLDKGGSGHLVVCIGFEQNGDPILNDPGTSVEIKRSIPKARFKAAWAESKNTVYIICPEEQHKSLLQSLHDTHAGD